MKNLREIIENSIIGEFEQEELKGICDLVSEFLMTEFTDTSIISAYSGHPDNKKINAPHIYLIIKDDLKLEPDKQRIIDATICQFLKGYKQVFIGTRAELRQLVLSRDYEITNTICNDDPLEVFERYWGNFSKQVRDGYSCSL